MGNVSSHLAAAAGAGTAPTLTGNRSSWCSKTCAKISHTAAGRDARGTAAAATEFVDSSTPAGRVKQQLEARLQHHMDLEDQRVKDLTEGVLYDLLPAALDVMLPNCEDPMQELDADRCRAVAATALAVSALMNAPPGFLEFLLCIPWHQLPQLQPLVSKAAEQQEQADQLLAQLVINEQERQLLVDMPIHPRLMQTVLGFLYKSEYANSLPPLLRPQQMLQDITPPHVSNNGNEQLGLAAANAAARSHHGIMLDTVAALLDGATALHCAAIRGNPAGVHHLLRCDADPTRQTAAGESAVELVPVCGCLNKDTRLRQCNCLTAAEQEVWECRSRQARTMIAKNCLSLFHVGLFGHFRLAWLCLLALMGLLYSGRTLRRPALEGHVRRRREQLAQAAEAQACSLLSCMRDEGHQGSGFLSTAKQKAEYRQPVVVQPLAVAGGTLSASTTSSVPAAGNTGRDTSSAGSNTLVLDAASISPQSETVVELDSFGSGTPGAAAEGPGLQDDTAVKGLYSGGEFVEGQCMHASGQCEQPADGVDKCKEQQRLENITQQHELGKLGSSDDTPEACLTAARQQEVVNNLRVVQQQDAATVLGPNPAAELAFNCYVKAVHALQSLGRQQSSIKVSNAGISRSTENSSTSIAGLVGELQPGCQPETGVFSSTDSAQLQDRKQQQGSQEQQMHVLEDEQAELYCGWAESVMLKFQACACPGCTALAVQVIRIAHAEVNRIYGCMYQLRQQSPQRCKDVRHCRSRVVYAHLALMCHTEARVSPSKASVWRTQQCLREWDALVETGVLQHSEGQRSSQAAAQEDVHMVDMLRQWARTADSDLIIAEALVGSSLGPGTTLAEALAAALSGSDAESAAEHSISSSSCLPVLAQPISSAMLDQLQAARGLALSPSPSVKLLAAQIADAAAQELSVGARLRTLLTTHPVPTSADFIAALEVAIAAAEPFSSLAADVAGARALHAQCCQRAAVATRLQGVVDQAAQLTSRVTYRNTGSDFKQDGGIVTGVALPVHGFDVDSWQQCIAVLESAAEEAKHANVSVARVRKLIKELNAQLAAAEAAALLQTCMVKRPCGSAALRVAISKAEAAAAGLSGIAASSSSTSGSGSSSTSGVGCASGGCAVFSELLMQQLQLGRKRLDTERAAEALHKAVLCHRSLAELPKLEASILNARKVGAEELCPGDYKAASELRARLSAAARVKQQLDAGAKALATAAAAGPVSKGGKQEEELTATLEATIREAQRWSDLLPEDIACAAEALKTCRNSSVCEAKLSHALLHGSSIAQLSRLIMDAAAAGVKVASARKVLKLQQLLEQAMLAAEDASSVSSTAHGQLAARLKAAEQGGVAHAVLEPAKKLLQKLAATEALCVLEAALKPCSSWSVTARMAAIRTALDNAEDALGLSITDLVEEQQLKQRARHQLEQQQQQCSKEAAEGPLSAASAGNAASDSSTALQRTDSAASSVAGDGLSMSSTATTGTQTSSKVAQRSPASSTAVDEVITAVQELAVQAWELLQQDQRLVEDTDRKRAEQERIRRELKEEQECAEAKSRKRSKAEREQQAAERKQARAKVLAERGRNLVALWGSRRTAAQQAANSAGPVDQSKGSGNGSDSPATTALSAAASARPATAPGLRSPVSSATTHRAVDLNTAPGSPSADQLLAEWSSQQQQVEPDVDRALPAVQNACGQARHLRGDSYDLLGDANNKLGRDVLELLDTLDHQVGMHHVNSPRERQQQLPVSSRLSLEDVPALQLKPDKAGRGLSQQRAFSSWQDASLDPGAGQQPFSASQHTNVIASGSSSHPATPKFGLVDLGGASWGVDRSGASFSGLRQPSPIDTAATTPLDSLWGGGPGPARLADDPALALLAPKSGSLARCSHPGTPQLLSSYIGTSSQSSLSCLSQGHGADTAAMSEAAVYLLLLQQQQQQQLLQQQQLQQQLLLQQLLQQQQQQLLRRDSPFPAVAGVGSQQSLAILPGAAHEALGVASGLDLSCSDYRSAAGDLAMHSEQHQQMQQQQHIGTKALGGLPPHMCLAGHDLGLSGATSRVTQQQQQLLQLQQQLMLDSASMVAGVSGGQALLPGMQADASVLSSGLPDATVSEPSSSLEFKLAALGNIAGDSSATFERRWIQSTDTIAGLASVTTGELYILTDHGLEGRSARLSEPDPVKQLPDDLSFSPPLPGPAGKAEH